MSCRDGCTAAHALAQVQQCRDFHFSRFSAIPGSWAIRPREANVQRSPLAELGTAPVIRRGQRRAAVWVGRGATARPRKAEWSSRLAAVFWVRHNQSIFKDPNGHNTTSQAYYDIIRIPLRISCCCRQLHPCYWYRLYRLYILTRDFFPHGIVGRLSKHFLFFFSQKEKTVGGCGVHRAPQSVRPDVEQAADH